MVKATHDELAAPGAPPFGRPLALFAGQLVALVACALLAAYLVAPGAGPRTTRADLEKQFDRQLHAAWPEGSFLGARIHGFGKPANENELSLNVGIRWDGRRSTSTGVTLYRAADRYYVGTFPGDGTLRPVGVILAFE